MDKRCFSNSSIYDRVDIETPYVVNCYRIINTKYNYVLFEGYITNLLAKKWSSKKNIKVELKE